MQRATAKKGSMWMSWQEIEEICLMTFKIFILYHTAEEICQRWGSGDKLRSAKWYYS
jgi:hypothetical protein